VHRASTYDLLHARVGENIARMTAWTLALSDAERRSLEDPKQMRAVMVEGYVDGYFRIRQTTPLILLTVDALNERREHTPARLWARYLAEEFAHDEVARGDLLRLFENSEDALRGVLGTRSISPPCAAMLGYFEWQARKGDPHLFMIYKLFLEQHAVEARDSVVSLVTTMGAESTRCIAMHQELDEGHLTECAKYIERYFSAQRLKEYLWAIDFMGDCLTQSQIWTAKQVL
jgi:hypothetical protein